MFVTKLHPSGTTLVYSMFLGGEFNETGAGLAVDRMGRVYVTGGTRSMNFPAVNTLQQRTTGIDNDAFVSVLDPSGGRLEFSTYLGGNADDLGTGIAVDSGGNVYVTGQTASTDFPTTPGAFDRTPNGAQDGFVVKLSAIGGDLTHRRIALRGRTLVSAKYAIDRWAVGPNTIPGIDGKTRGRVFE